MNFLRSRAALWTALGVYFVLTALLIVRVPLGAAPDEFAHFEYVESVATTGKLPVFRGQVPPAPGYEFHQPPLYYVVSAVLWRALPVGVENYAVRVVSLLCGLATLLLVWATARRIFPNRPEIAGVAALFGALLPVHQAVGAVAGNDALAGLICAGLFFAGTRALLEGTTRRDAVAIGVLAGLGLLTKTTTLVVAFAAIGALLAAPRRSELVESERGESSEKITKNPAMPPFRAALGAVIIALIVSAPILARNQSLYGDPLALGAFAGAANTASPGQAEFAQIGLGALDYWRALGWMILLTTWGFFGGPNAAVQATGAPFDLKFPFPVFTPLLLACVLAPLVALWGWKTLDDESRARFAPAARFFVAGVLLVLLAWIRFALDHFAGGQARYLHPALLPVAVFLAAGWVGALGERRLLFVLASLVFGGVMLALTLLNLIVWRTLV